MPKLKRLETKPPVFLLNDGLFFCIDRSISETPVYFRQQDAETFFDNPFLLGDQIWECFRWSVRCRWFSPRYRTLRFDSRHMRPYTNEELLSLFDVEYDWLLSEAKHCDEWDFLGYQE